MMYFFSTAMDQAMADEETKMIEETPEDTTEAKEEVKEENLEGSGDASATQPEDKTEEEMEQELKETPIAIPRYTAHNVPDWDLEEMKGKYEIHFSFNFKQILSFILVIES